MGWRTALMSGYVGLLFMLRPVGQDVIRDFSNGSQFLLHDFGMADIGFAFDERTHLEIK